MSCARWEEGGLLAEPHREICSDLRASLNLDSTDVVDLVMRSEWEFGVRLATEELAAVKRVGDLLDVVEARLLAKPESPWNDPSGCQLGLT
jgi:acyl carrier protein